MFIGLTLDILTLLLCAHQLPADNRCGNTSLMLGCNLALQKGGINNIVFIRPLTQEELEEHQRHWVVLAPFLEKFALFPIFAHQYSQWMSEIESIRTSSVISDDGRLRLRSRLMALLSTGYALREHFTCAWSTLLPKNANREKPSDFLNKIFSVSFHTSFMFDYRNYIQHVGTIIGGYNHHLSVTASILTVEESPDDIMQRYKKWNEWTKRGLRGMQGKIDIVRATAEYFHYLTTDYATFLANHIAPEVSSADIFYTRLTEEAIQVGGVGLMVFVSPKHKLPDKLEYLISYPTNRPLAALGITLKPTSNPKSLEEAKLTPTTDTFFPPHTENSPCVNLAQKEV